MLRQRISLHVDDSAKYLDWRFSCLIDSSCIPVQSTMASSDSSSNRSLWSACGINVYVRRLFRAVQRSLIALGVELRYCTRAHTHTHTHTTLSVQSRGRSLHWEFSWGIAHTHTTLSVQSRGRSLHWGLSWGIAHTRLFRAVQRSLIALGVQLRYCTHDSFYAVQRLLIALGVELRYCTHMTLSVQFRGHLWLWIQLLYTGETLLHCLHLCSV